MLAAIAVTGSYLDLRTRRLPNWLCLAGLVAGLAFGLAVGGWPAAAIALLHALIALIVGAGLFALGGIGGGDAKFYAALAAWFPLQAGARPAGERLADRAAAPDRLATLSPTPDARW